MGVGPAHVVHLVLPQGLPEQAAGAVLALQRASLACQAAVQTLDTSPGICPDWDGQAARGYRHRRAQLSRRCAELDQVSADTAGLVAAWSRAATADRVAMVRAKDTVEEVQQAQTLSAIAGPSPDRT